MSDLYLTLRRRLNEVAEWVDLGTDVMWDARDAKGLSRAYVARRLHVSEKTYERWEKRGAVPRHTVAAVARVLDLEIEQPTRRTITIADEDEASKLDALLEMVLGLQTEVGSLRQEVRALAARESAPPKRKARQRSQTTHRRVSEGQGPP
jgi:transcriptional regulator with XRE-family HTH domain